MTGLVLTSILLWYNYSVVFKENRFNPAHHVVHVASVVLWYYTRSWLLLMNLWCCITNCTSGKEYKPSVGILHSSNATVRDLCNLAAITIFDDINTGILGEDTSRPLDIMTGNVLNID
jgi:thiosulfate reductase cytochrome b subunit